MGHMTSMCLGDSHFFQLFFPGVIRDRSGIVQDTYFGAYPTLRAALGVESGAKLGLKRKLKVI